MIFMISQSRTFTFCLQISLVLTSKYVQFYYLFWESFIKFKVKIHIFLFWRENIDVNIPMENLWFMNDVPLKTFQTKKIFSQTAWWVQVSRAKQNVKAPNIFLSPAQVTHTLDLDHHLFSSTSTRPPHPLRTAPILRIIFRPAGGLVSW